MSRLFSPDHKIIRLSYAITASVFMLIGFSSVTGAYTRSVGTRECEMLSNRSMPRCTVIPELAYPNVVEAADWLCDVFGFSLRLRIANHRMQLNVGDGAVVLTAQAAADRPLETAHGVMVRVEDVDGHHAHAFARGARILRSPADYPYGERQYTAADPGGHCWTFSQSIADVNPEDWGGAPGKL
jgi:uncharacterized glyoxalase superfamily protein PhnB